MILFPHLLRVHGVNHLQLNFPANEIMSGKSEEITQTILPQSLGKLEIVPPITKDQEHQLPSVNLNPFLHTHPEQEISSTEREKLFGPSCNCSQTNPNAATTNKEYSVKRCAQFKPRKRHEFILKQPMLKTFARCLHHCQKEMKNTLSGNESSSVEKQTSATEPSYEGAKWSLRNNFNVDFKSLNLSENQPCTSSCDLHKSYSFRYPQSERKLHHSTKSEENEPLSTSSDRTNQQNISCSQQAVQAMWSPSTNNGDVTTDELACYFETIVHIPKKMSTMAEQMYIWVKILVSFFFFFCWSEVIDL